jgi:phosphoenolpyruvate carboxylase
MVGYSDSAKEGGVLASRIAIASALPKLEKVCQKAGLETLFFHGSGGSIDRGGGSIEDQTAWWPRSALQNYKVTIQGEMVERSLATPEITKGQLEKILKSVSARLQEPSQDFKNEVLSDFALRVSACYRNQITSPEFLNLIERATPYSYLHYLKIGSRPAKRAAQLQVSGLRAIPWILCWTQTRVLFPTWWGTGQAWAQSSDEQKAQIKKSFAVEPVFTSYIKALGFTLAKIEMAVWKMYLTKSSLEPEQAQKAFATFEEELNRTKTFFYEVTGQTNWLWFRPWLAESILLRSAMIHPLNLLQIIAEHEKDGALLRTTVTGIASGMLTTG